MDEEKDKNLFLFDDLTSYKKNTPYKIYQYFYSFYKEKTQTKTFFKYFQIFIEGIQFISYSFSPVHHNSWKLQLKHIKKINNIIDIFRLSALMQLLNYKTYSAILYILIILVFLLFLIVIIQILFDDSVSKKIRKLKIIIYSIIDIISIIFYIPITEITLIPIKCIYLKGNDTKNNKLCDKNTIYLNIILGSLAAFLLFIWCIFMINFSFFPFQAKISNFRINSNNDIIIIIMKLLLIIQNLFISNEYISIAILLTSSIIIFINCFYDKTYNNKNLEIAINAKNFIILWTYFVLFLSKILQSFNVDGYIYLLVYGYPFFFYLSFIINKDKKGFFSFSNTFNSPKEYILKAKFNIKLINSFIERNQNTRNSNENERQQNMILLKGNAEFHTFNCNDIDCPIKRFLNNEGNFNIQRQCLLNYMNNFFNRGLKKFPENIYILILYITFNYSKRFNLNSVKTNLMRLKNITSNLKEKYIIYCMEENIKEKNSNNALNLFNKNSKDNDSQIDMNEQKYKKLKYLIENSIKLYAEFWGIFSTNVSSILNTKKLYLLGEKLNIYLNEINNLWDNELKNKNINNENQNIIQLYSKFLLEILWDRKKSLDVAKKLNYENINNYNLNENKKKKEEKNNILDLLVDNQDYIIFCDSDEKGNSKIIQCSLSLCELLGYQKFDLIGRPVTTIFPNNLIEGNAKYIEESIKLLHNEQINQKEDFRENALTNNTTLLVIKNKMGYIFIMFSTYKIYDDNDYSDSFLVKIKIERKESKSEYAYYMLANPDLSIDCISSSAINMGLSLDLLKKYIVKLDILIRSAKDMALNLFEDYIHYDEEPKVITWVFPNIIYPKENSKQNKNERIEDLIEKSAKKQLYLQIKAFIYKNVNYGFLLKFMEINKKKNIIKLNNELYIPKPNKHLIMFDLLNLSYIRTLLVNKKSGLRNLRTLKNDNDKIKNEINKDIKKETRKKSNKFLDLIQYNSSEELEKVNKNIILTREKIIELQGNNYIEIKTFIFSLPMYGKNISLEKFTPNREKYSASKITEPSIKIQLSKFCKRMDEKFLVAQNFKRKKNKSILINNENPELLNSISTNNSSDLNSLYSSELSIKNNEFQREEINKGFNSDGSSSFANVFKNKTINYITFLICFIFLETFIFILMEFIITYKRIKKVNTKIQFLYDSYSILNNMLYIKYFVTEGVLANSLNMNYINVVYNGGLTSFLNEISKELSLNREEFTDIYDNFTSADICEEFNSFMKNTKINISTLSSNIPNNFTFVFNSAMTRIPAAVNDLVSAPFLMNMGHKDTYELMHNLLNEYYINWEKVITILLNDSKKSTNLKLPLMIIGLIYFLISFFILIVFLILLSNFSLERQKPINLFLTLKRQVFENLKISAENFSNKLLNKFFGNEDNEEESRQDYNANIQPNDVNIVKFKAANEYNYSIKKGLIFFNELIIIFLFLLINIIYFIIIYFDFRNRMNKIFQFIILFSKTNIARNDYILSLDIFKSYLFNKSIPILNKKETRNHFIENYLNLTNKFEDSLIYNSKGKSFLGAEYLQKYSLYLSGNFRDLLDNEFYQQNKQLLEKTENGLKPLLTRFQEIIRYYTIKYCNYLNSSKIDEESYEISDILKENEFKLFEINILAQLIMRIWYKGLMNLMIKSFHDYIDGTKLIYIILFICLIIIIIVYYTIIWKTAEEKLRTLLKESSNLINLIPQEIKKIMFEKLNEN